MFAEAMPKSKRSENKNISLEGRVRVKLRHPVSEGLKAQAAAVRNEPGMPLGTGRRLSALCSFLFVAAKIEVA